jgi:two-component system, NarL family, nitrate/nitrite response regulator NarL
MSVIVFSDEPLLLRGLQAKLEERPVQSPVKFLHRLRDVLPTLSNELAELLLLDLPAECSLSMIREFRATRPACHIVLWMRNVSAEAAYQAIEMGIRGILKKTVGGEEVIECLEAVLKGELWLDKDLTMTLLTSKPVNLTRRESQLVGLLAQGLKNKEIATALTISEGTVKVYLSRLFEKVGAKDRFELALFGVRNLRNMQADEMPSEELPAGQQSLRSIMVRRYA